MITSNICNVDAATLCEKGLISPGQQIVSRTVGNGQDFEQGKYRCNQLLAARTHFSKKGLNQRKKTWMFFNEVDEDGRVCPTRPPPRSAINPMRPVLAQHVSKGQLLSSALCPTPRDQESIEVSAFQERR